MSVTEKKLVFTGVFNNISGMKVDDLRYGEEEDHFGLYWRAYAKRMDDFMGIRLPEENLVFGFGCKEFENPNDWSVNVDYEFRMKAKNGEVLVQSASDTFKKKDTDFVLYNHCKWNEREKYVVDDKITVEYRIHITSTTGIPNWETKEEFSDFFVNTAGEKFTMSKEQLVIAKSPYLNSLINRDFEKGKKPEITPIYVDGDDLLDYYGALHDRFDEDSVFGALRVAKQWKAHGVIEKCEEYLKKEGKEDEFEDFMEDFEQMKLDEGSEEEKKEDEKVEEKKMETPTSFEFWNKLSDKLKLRCVEKMSFKTRFLLRGTSKTERRLLNSHRFKIHEINLQDHKNNFYGEFMIVDKGEHYFLRSNDPKYICDTLWPLLAYCLENADIHWFQSDNFPCMTPKQLAKFKNPGPYNVRRVLFLTGSYKQQMWFFNRCVEKSILTIEMTQPSDEKEFPIDQFMKIPSIGAVKWFIVNMMNSPGAVTKFTNYCIQNDMPIGTQFKFYTPHPGTLNEFFTNFRNRVVGMIPNKMIQIGVNSEKRMILNFDRVLDFMGQFNCEMFVVSVVPPKMNADEFNWYTKFNAGLMTNYQY